jgi:hypothetical protein
MPDGLYGVDSISKVDSALLAKVTGVFGGPPLFWGRIFSATDAPGENNSYHPSENKILANNNIRLVPIARTGTNVGGSAADGGTDAKGQVANLLKTMPFLKPQKDPYFLFLEVTTALAVPYYQGWAKGVISAGQGRIRPAAYIRSSARATIDVIRGLTDRPEALWVVRWQKGDGKARKTADGKWDPLKGSNNTKCPIVLWQYQNDEDKGFNCNWVDPSIDAESFQLLTRVHPAATEPDPVDVGPTKEPAKPSGPTKQDPAKPSGGSSSKPSGGGSSKQDSKPSALDDVRKGKSILKSGSKGDAVKELQQGLADRGYKVDVDGAYGPKTAAAVKQLQKDQKIGQDGAVGPMTMKAFDATPAKS